MPKVWVLDTETKGTGAEMVPLEKALKELPARRRIRAPRPRSKPPTPAAPAPAPPRTFKLVDVMTRQVIAEDVAARDAIGVLEGIRSLVDVSIYVLEHEPRRWRMLTHREQKLLWGFRGRRAG